MTIEIVDLPLEMVDLSIVFCKRLPEAITNSHSESRLVSKIVKDNISGNAFGCGTTVHKASVLLPCHQIRTFSISSFVLPLGDMQLVS